VGSLASLRSKISQGKADFTNPFVNLNTLSTKKAEPCDSTLFVEGPVGFEPTTRGLKGRCSNLLSYGPVATLHEGNLMFPSSRGAPK
jgi:hypothetical protein